ncbi:MAG: helix-turn-helix domain-containing protein [Pseudomonadota bacterium]
MARETLTGSRIRERRIMAGLRQVDLARSLGISASYLNLIEHNRRRIGGKLLVAIAQALKVEPSLLTEGAGEALVATLTEAAADIGAPTAETDRGEEFARRFPGWAELVATQHRRIATLERTAEALTDRLAHDDQLATSLHEVLSTAAAVRSVASILAEPGDLAPEWRARFTKNLNDDSRRLADSSKSLVAYLDANETGNARRALPREEAESIFADAGYFLTPLERPGAALQDVADLLEIPTTQAARKILAAMVTQYLDDAKILPLDTLKETLGQVGLDGLSVAQTLGLALPVVLRRMAILPEAITGVPLGLVICDAAGSILFQKSVGGFTVPRAAPPCPLWPLFLALHRPQVPVSQRVTQVGRGPGIYDCLAVASMVAGTEYAPQPQISALMLMRPVDEAAQGPEPAEVGSNCRVCARTGCSARREPSLLPVSPGLSL